MARIQLGNRQVVLKEGEWSGWLPVEFEAMPLSGKVKGMSRLPHQGQKTTWRPAGAVLWQLGQATAGDADFAESTEDAESAVPSASSASSLRSLRSDSGADALTASTPGHVR